jgi:GNAT superfamily N-acetyltransferase
MKERIDVPQDLTENSAESSNISVKQYTPETNSAEAGFELFRDFVHRLREEYPNLNYPEDNIVERIAPKEGGALVTYIISDTELAVGVAIGRASGNSFQGHWFIVDPKYQNTDVAPRLMTQVAADFDEVRLLASVADVPRDANKERKISRQNALIRYYQKLGMNPDLESESYQYAHMPGAPMPMVWKKQDNGESD